MNLTLKQIGILCFFFMFIFSGIRKIFNYKDVVGGLTKKTKFPYPINDLGIIGVILLEVIGSLIMIYYFFDGKIDNILIKNICLLFILFMIVVTPLYHPPNKNIIPFLSNLTILGGFILIYTII